MKVRIEHAQFAEAVAWSAKALPRHPTAPVSSGLVLTAGGGRLAISGFEHGQSATAYATADVVTPGSALVSGALLAEITRSLPRRAVEISVAGSKMQLSCGPYSYTLQTLLLDDPAPPETPSASGTVSGAVSGSAFAAAVVQVAVAAGRDESLPFLTGIRFKLERDALRLVATDRDPLAVRGGPRRGGPERAGSGTLRRPHRADLRRRSGLPLPVPADPTRPEASGEPVVPAARSSRSRAADRASTRIHAT